MRGLGLLLVIVVAGLLARPAWAATGGERRVALVIGNGDYRHGTRLVNAVADARAFRAELLARGFGIDNVVYRENADRRAMNDALEEFLGKLATDAIGVVYYSGHGVQIGGVNYLLPVDLQAEKESDVAYDAVDLSRLLDRISQVQARFALAVIDACRNNPFEGRGRSIGAGRGLAAPSGNAAGIMVIFAAGANQTALDSLGSTDRESNGLFTREFLKAIRTPGLDVQEVVRRVRLAVIEKAKAVGHTQTPAVYDQSVGTFVFTPAGGGTPVADDAGRIQADDAARIQAEVAAARAETERLKVEAARAELARIKAEQEQLRRQQQQQQQQVAALVPPPPPTVTPGGNTSSGAAFRDCADCPEMVVVSAGSFMMGSNGIVNDEKPVHRVTIPRPFAVGKYEVTQGEWEAVMGSNPSWFKGARNPVERVKWKDIQEFVARLNAKVRSVAQVSTGGDGPYRLLSEAEWEYVARAATTTKYPCGDTETCLGSIAWYDDNSGERTHAVGGKSPNAFGLYDLLGNIGERVQDCWSENYSGAPTDGSPNTFGNCGEHTVRGGSWNDGSWFLRSTSRIKSDDRVSISAFGFRLAKTLP